MHTYTREIPKAKTAVEAKMIVLSKQGKLQNDFYPRLLRKGMKKKMRLQSLSYYITNAQNINMSLPHVMTKKSGSN